VKLDLPTSQEEHILRVFENRMPQKIFGRKRQKVTGRWRQPENEEVHDLYGGAVA